MLAAQLMHQLPGYAEEVRALAFRPDGEKLAVGGTDRMIHIYDVQTGQLAAGGGLGVRRSLALWNQPRRRLLINAEEGLRMWEVETGTEQTAPLPPNRYLHLATSPDGRWIAGVTPDAIVHLWDHDKRTIRTMDGPRSAPNFLAFSHDSTILFGAVGNEGTVWLWDITKLEPKLLVIEATEGCSVEAVALHPNGQWLLCGGVDFLSTSGTTGNVCLWDLPSKKRILSIPDGATCLIFDATGDRFAFATPDGTVLIAATATGDLLLEIEGRDGEQINDLVFCPEGNALIGAANDSTLRVWDTESGELLGCRQFGVPIHSLVIDRTGRLFAGNENTTCFELAPTRLNELS